LQQIVENCLPVEQAGCSPHPATQGDVNLLRVFISVVKLRKILTAGIKTRYLPFVKRNLIYF
jgi:hypothetical protein